ncbi:uncharacterized protein BJ171DRAFT_488936 [Polychytrium aggregatum]|uniref:uncharacterized protein n=1 Tax=Polychytrium aggregatum TaxID=110093 RepID=UPI0022FE2A11|nr:uncharacterized protein BJ171DRAFT_488936 [Polychytrium aggregatum]KAI9208458.1 hypothetical protein BJ171DRAFT_488936 [Polychytrium aggregatum]
MNALRLCLALLFAAVAVFAQAQQPVLPTTCASACQPVLNNILTCKQSSTPQTPDDWTAAATKLAQCICPFLSMGDVVPTKCIQCLQTSPSDSNSPSTKLITNLEIDCGTNAAKAPATILAVFNATYGIGVATGSSSSIPNQGSNPTNGNSNKSAAATLSASLFAGVIVAVAGAVFAL